jgi:hypothetical protein
MNAQFLSGGRDQRTTSISKTKAENNLRMEAYNCTSDHMRAMLFRNELSDFVLLYFPTYEKCNYEIAFQNFQQEVNNTLSTLMSYILQNL